MKPSNENDMAETDMDSGKNVDTYLYRVDVSAWRWFVEERIRKSPSKGKSLPLKSVIEMMTGAEEHVVKEDVPGGPTKGTVLVETEEHQKARVDAQMKAYTETYVKELAGGKKVTKFKLDAPSPEFIEKMLRSADIPLKVTVTNSEYIAFGEKKPGKSYRQRREAKAHEKKYAYRFFLDEPAPVSTPQVEQVVPIGTTPPVAMGMLTAPSGPVAPTLANSTGDTKANKGATKQVIK